ncbi:hypothetical protein [Agrobacterium tumefaciens]|uniref:hypothetical protein n=1 Tax=Agrobacterium tumefaciens TaxID=358 RepID=UPI003B9DED3C
MAMTAILLTAKFVQQAISVSSLLRSNSKKIQTVPKPIAKRDVAQRRTWLLIAAGQMKEMLLECI